MKGLETAVGAVFAPTRFSLVRISVRDLVADRKSLVRKSGVGGGGQNLIVFQCCRQEINLQSSTNTVRVKIITGSLVILENLFSPNYRYRYRLEIRMNFHYRYRLGVRSHPFISIDSQLPS